jgi:NAD(P)-dependent dehydrogenase (short-subunit alcohol dehydrogenase family)
MKLAGKVAVITGGSKGIGFGCAKIFGKYGARVIIAARGEEDGKKAEQELVTAGTEAAFVSCDVTSETDMKAVIGSAIDRWGQLDCIVNNAGWHPPTISIDEISVADFESLLRLNLTSTFMGCKFAIEHLRKTKGNIINMSSEVALIGQSSAASYATTKAGQLGLTRALAIDLAPEGVRVNAVCPAGVMTPLMREWAGTEFDPETALQSVDHIHPLGRMATIEEMGEVCAFLASDEASFMTGQTVCPDGGAALGYGKKWNP